LDIQLLFRDISVTFSGNLDVTIGPIL
jgi:hypothetical protein